MSTARLCSASARRSVTLPFYQFDAFALHARAGTGNPAAVCLLRHDIASLLDDVDLQNIAAENNLSETAFVEELVDHSLDSGSKFRLRWFTPTTEVNLCGHATLAAAAAVFDWQGCQIKNSASTLHFETMSGLLAVEKQESKGDGLRMTFPENPPSHVFSSADIAACEPALEALGLPLPGVEETDVGIEQILYSEATKKLVVCLNHSSRSLDFLRSLAPSSDLLASHDGSLFTGIVVTVLAHGDPGFDFASRYFAPWNGIPEDPVNGSSHTILAPYYSKMLSKADLVARVVSKRGGELGLRWTKEQKRVYISGQLACVIKGDFEWQV